MGSSKRVSNYSLVSRKKRNRIIITVGLIMAVSLALLLTWPLISDAISYKNITITFETNSAEKINPVKTNNRISFSADIYIPVKEKNTFAGWYLNKECTQKYETKILTTNTTLYAKWLPNYEIVVQSGESGLLVNLLGEHENEIKYELPSGSTTEPIYVLPNSGLYFIKWSDGVVERSRQISVIQDIAVEALYVSTGDVKTFDGFKYIETDDFIKIVGCTLNDKTISIPNLINNKPVTVLGDSSFTNSIVNKIVLNENLTYIEPKTFSFCNELREIDTSVNEVFEFDANKKILLTNQRKDLVCSLVTQNVTVLNINNIEKIEPYAFANNLNITQVNIDNTLKTIGISIFNNCVQLTTVNLNSKLSKIPYQMFYNCEKLKTLTTENNIVTEVGSYSFYQCSAFAFSDIDKLVYMGSYAFAGNNLKTMNINELGYFGVGVFENNLALKTVSFKDLEVLPEKTFSGCTALENISLPNNLEIIKQEAFKRCFSLKQIEMPNTLKIIEAYSFIYCNKIESIIMSTSIETIGDYAFYGCTALKKLVLFSKDVTLFENSVEKDIEIEAPHGGSVENFCNTYGIKIK